MKENRPTWFMNEHTSHYLKENSSEDSRGKRRVSTGPGHDE